MIKNIEECKDVISKYLDGEEIRFIANQKKMYSLFSQRSIIAATDERVVLLYRYRDEGYSIKDFPWAELISIEEETCPHLLFPYSRIRLLTQCSHLVIPYLDKEEGRRLAEFAMEKETAWHRGHQHGSDETTSVSLNTPTSFVTSNREYIESLRDAHRLASKGHISSEEYQVIRTNLLMRSQASNC